MPEPVRGGKPGALVIVSSNPTGPTIPASAVPIDGDGLLMASEVIRRDGIVGRQERLADAYAMHVRCDYVIGNGILNGTFGWHQDVGTSYVYSEAVLAVVGNRVP